MSIVFNQTNYYLNAFQKNFKSPVQVQWHDKFREIICEFSMETVIELWLDARLWPLALACRVQNGLQDADRIVSCMEYAPAGKELR